MAKFIFYIVNLNEATVVGTNDVDELEESGVIDNPDYVIIHNEGSYFNDCRDPIEITPFKAESPDTDLDTEGVDD